MFKLHYFSLKGFTMSNRGLRPRLLKVLASSQILTCETPTNNNQQTSIINKHLRIHFFWPSGICCNIWKAASGQNISCQSSF